MLFGRLSVVAVEHTTRAAGVFGAFYMAEPAGMGVGGQVEFTVEEQIAAIRRRVPVQFGARSECSDIFACGLTPAFPGRLCVETLATYAVRAGAAAVCGW